MFTELHMIDFINCKLLSYVLRFHGEIMITLLECKYLQSVENTLLGHIT